MAAIRRSKVLAKLALVLKTIWKNGQEVNLADYFATFQISSSAPSGSVEETLKKERQTTSFAPFLRLPMELRLEIWRHCYPKARRYELNCTSLKNQSIQIPPISSKINHESRVETFRAYTLIPHAPYWSYGEAAYVYWNQDRDILRIDFHELINLNSVHSDQQSLRALLAFRTKETPVLVILDRVRNLELCTSGAYRKPQETRFVDILNYAEVDIFMWIDRLFRRLEVVRFIERLPKSHHQQRTSELAAKAERDKDRTRWTRETIKKVQQIDPSITWTPMICFSESPETSMSEFERVSVATEYGGPAFRYIKADKIDVRREQ